MNLETELEPFFKSLDVFCNLDLDEIKTFSKKYKNEKNFHKFLKFYKSVLIINNINSSEHKNYILLCNITHEVIQTRFMDYIKE